MAEMNAGDSSTQKRRIGLPIETDPSVLSLHWELKQARLREIEAFEAAKIESAQNWGAHRKGYDKAVR